MFARSRSKRTPEPLRIVVLSFLVAIALGSLLLAMPFANADGLWHIDTRSLFLATSSLCVTGLDPVGVGSALTDAGLVLIALFAQLGGIGVMTIGTFLFLAAGRALSVNEERSVMSTLGETHPQGVRPLLVGTFVFVLFWEIVGAIAFGLRIRTLDPSLGSFRAFAHGFFYAIMSFANAGFNPFPEGRLIAADPFLCVPAMVLAVVGGIGFVVHRNLFSLRPWRRDRLARGRLSLHSRVVLEGLLAILLLDAIVFLSLEGARSFAAGPFLGPLFQGVTTRATGFEGLRLASCSRATIFFTGVLMFVGAAPGSTGGGVKTTTLWVLGATVVALFHNRQCPELHGRTIPRHVVNEAISIFLLFLIAVCFFAFALFLAEAPTPDRAGNLVFETVSALCNNGLSVADTTASLSPVGRLVLVGAMFLGRVGPAALVLTLFRPHVADRTKRYPEENILVG